MSLVLTITELLIGAGLLLVFGRLAVGPSLPDRVVALDLIAMLTVGMIGVYAVESHEVVYLDVAASLALLAFLGTVAFARYLERRGHDE